MDKWTPEKIKVLRKKLGLSQKAFGERLRVTENYIYLLEADKKKPSGILQLLLDCVKKEGR
jgi:DNA-binding transcriptional regulator YiaG